MLPVSLKPICREILLLDWSDRLGVGFDTGGAPISRHRDSQIARFRAADSYAARVFMGS